MTWRAERLRSAPARETPIRWWLAPAWSLLWRLPLLFALSLLCAWFAFRGLVHLAFLFDARPILTFLFAPVLLPFAALPAFCFWFYIRALPGFWRQRALPDFRRALALAGGSVGALLLALIADLVQINLIRLMGVRLPRLPLDPY